MDSDFRYVDRGIHYAIRKPGSSAGEFNAREVVIASGGYQKPFRPAGAGELPVGLHVIDVEQYTNPGALPAGRVLVMGSGQTGCQPERCLHAPHRYVTRDEWELQFAEIFDQVNAFAASTPVNVINPEATR